MRVNLDIPDRLAKKIAASLGYNSSEFKYRTSDLRDDIKREILNLLEEKYKYQVVV